MKKQLLVFALLAVAFAVIIFALAGRLWHPKQQSRGRVSQTTSDQLTQNPKSRPAIS